MATAVRNDEVAAVTVEFDEPEEKPATHVARMLARLKEWRSRRALARTARLAGSDATPKKTEAAEAVGGQSVGSGESAIPNQGGKTGNTA